MSQQSNKTIHPPAGRRARHHPHSRMTISWPQSHPLNPSEIDAVRGWYCVTEGGMWNVDAMSVEMRPKLLHAAWRGQRIDAAPRHWETLLFEPKKNLFVTIGQSVPEYSVVRVWADSPERAEAEFRRLRSAYFRERLDDPNTAEFFVLTVQMGEPQARLILTRPQIHTADDLRLHYGEDFLDWHLDFLRQLKTKSSGLAILQGSPGVGKTSYLRGLMAELRHSHRFYFLPISSYSLLTAPACVDFWLVETERYKNLKKIVVIEDAETLLVKRGSDNQEALSNLLNLADGFLGDAVKVSVICTLNTPIDRLDPAVVRPGRLIAAREFRRLTPAEAQPIAKRRALTLPPQESYSLGEIYNHGSSREQLTAGNRRVGFATQ